VRRSTAGGFKIAVLDQYSIVRSPAEIHTELNRRFPKIRLDTVRGGLSNTALISILNGPTFGRNQTINAMPIPLATPKRVGLKSHMRLSGSVA
jgi:hypothetical protein